MMISVSPLFNKSSSLPQPAVHQGQSKAWLKQIFCRFPGRWLYIYLQSIREVGVAVKTIFPKTQSLKVGLQWKLHSTGFWNIACKRWYWQWDYIGGVLFLMVGNFVSDVGDGGWNLWFIKVNDWNGDSSSAHFCQLPVGGHKWRPGWI